MTFITRYLMVVFLSIVSVLMNAAHATYLAPRSFNVVRYHVPVRKPTSHVRLPLYERHYLKLQNPCLYFKELEDCFKPLHPNRSQQYVEPLTTINHIDLNS